MSLKTFSSLLFMDDIFHDGLQISFSNVEKFSLVRDLFDTSRKLICISVRRCNILVLIYYFVEINRLLKFILYHETLSCQFFFYLFMFYLYIFFQSNITFKEFSSVETQTDDYGCNNGCSSMCVNAGLPIAGNSIKPDQPGELDEES